MRTFFLKGLAALTMGFAMTACTQDFNYEEQEQQASLNNAQQTLGFYIPDNQDWVMSSTISANIPINFTDGETYTVKVYSNDPLMDGVGYVLAKETVANGQNFVASFRVPSYKGAYSIGITNSEGKTMYRTAYLEDGQLTEFVEDKPVEIETSDSRTRAITVNGDTYSAFTFPTNEELTAVFPTAIPKDADEVADLETLYQGKTAPNGQTMWDLYAIYVNKITKDYNLKITKTGTFDVGGCQNGADNLYNVYVSVDGDVTIKRPQNAFYRLFILKGNVTLDANFGEMAGVISIAEGATLNDLRNHIAANDGIKVYNRGTYNVTNTSDYWNGSANVKFDIGNKASLYNEGQFIVKYGGMSYSAGAGNTSYFINMGDNAYLEASSMMLNSTCNFYNSGVASISGETFVTQNEITWINNGHYTTGSMKFSAHNGTFYNYCQLIVTDNCSFLDGKFNMMDNSYAEFGTALFNNFHVVMGNNSGINIKNGSKWGRQGSGILQGFFAKNDNAQVFVRLGGKTFVPDHKGAAFHVSGEKLVLAYENIKFYSNYNDLGIYSTYSGINYWDESTAESLQKAKSENTTWNTHNVTTFVTGDDFNKVTVQTVEGKCAVNWKVPGVSSITEENQTWTYAFEDNKTRCDFDLNDVVIQVRKSETETTKLIIKLVAAGCEYDNYVWLGNNIINWPNGKEVHEAFGTAHGVMVNTGNNKGVDMPAVETTIDVPEKFDFQNADFKIRPFRINSDPTNPDNAVDDYITIVKQGVNTGLWGPLGLAIPAKWKWPKERKTINYAYPAFTEWGKEPELTLRADEAGWYENPTSGLIYGE